EEEGRVCYRGVVDLAWSEEEVANQRCGATPGLRIPSVCLSIDVETTRLSPLLGTAVLGSLLRSTPGYELARTRASSGFHSVFSRFHSPVLGCQSVVTPTRDVSQPRGVSGVQSGSACGPSTLWRSEVVVLVASLGAVLLVAISIWVCVPLWLRETACGVAFTDAGLLPVELVEGVLAFSDTCLWLLSAGCWLVVNSGEVLPKLFSVGSSGKPFVVLLVRVSLRTNGALVVLMEVLPGPACIASACCSVLLDGPCCLVVGLRILVKVLPRIALCRFWRRFSPGVFCVHFGPPLCCPYGSMCAIWLGCVLERFSQDSSWRFWWRFSPKFLRVITPVGLCVSPWLGWFVMFSCAQCALPDGGLVSGEVSFLLARGVSAAGAPVALVHCVVPWVAPGACDSTVCCAVCLFVALSMVLNATGWSVASWVPKGKSLGRRPVPPLSLLLPFSLTLRRCSASPSPLVCFPAWRRAVHCVVVSWTLRGARRRWRTDVKGPIGVRSSLWATPGLRIPSVYLSVDVATARHVTISEEALAQSSTTLSRCFASSRYGGVAVHFAIAMGRLCPYDLLIGNVAGYLPAFSDRREVRGESQLESEEGVDSTSPS
ncbi:hypothetical protein Taro_052093, partial [Colocasia esculenta]|nr:hypothetical protein [Colocasia esculenta]